MAKRAYAPKNTRSFALVGHRSSGKTSLGEVLLTKAGVTRTVGRVDDHSSLLDHEPDERRRGMTLGPAFAWLEWQDHVLYLVDTPGSAELSHERTLALAGVDAVVVVVSGPDGVEVGTEQALVEAGAQGIPRVVVVNKLDRAPDLADATVADVTARVEEIAGVRAVPVQLPFVDDEGVFSGVVCPIERRVLRYDLEGSGAFSPEPIPERLQAATDAAWERIVESVALTDDELLEQYLEFLELPHDVVRRGLARAVQDGDIVPVLYASAARNVGADPLLDFACWALPSSEESAGGPFVARLLASRLDVDGARYHVLRVLGGEPPRSGRWRNPAGGEDRIRKLYQIRGPRRTTAVNTGAGSIVATWEPLSGRPGDVWTDGAEPDLGRPALPAPMMSYVVTPLSGRDEPKLRAALDTLLQLDAALTLEACPLTGAPVLSGLGQGHLDHAIGLIRDRLGVPVATNLPPVPYREVPARGVRGAVGVHRREADDDVKEFGECVVDVTPAPMDDGVRFEADLDDDLLPERYVPPIEEGVRRGLRHGPTAGYPVHGVVVRCVGGEYDLFASEEEHFTMAGERAIAAALHTAGTRLYEPWSALEIRAPADDVGAVINDVSSHRGRILGMEVDGATARIRVHAPYRDVRTFAARLQSLTAGRGAFVRQHSHYAPVPGSLVPEAVSASPFRALVQRPDTAGLQPGNGDVSDRGVPSTPVAPGMKG